MIPLIVVVLIILFILIYPAAFGDRSGDDKTHDTKLVAFFQAFGLMFIFATAFLVIILKLLQIFGIIEILV